MVQVPGVVEGYEDARVYEDGQGWVSSAGALCPYRVWSISSSRVSVPQSVGVARRASSWLMVRGLACVVVSSIWSMLSAESLIMVSRSRCWGILAPVARVILAWSFSRVLLASSLSFMDALTGSGRIFYLLYFSTL